MEPTRGELAGVVDLFGALTRAELGRALVELAYKRGEECQPEAFDPVVEHALASYHLVAYEPTDSDGVADDADPELLAPGPVAFPELPEGATDLPHILDVTERAVDRETVGRAAAEQFRRDAAAAVAEGDSDRMELLLDVSYELEAWAPVDLADARRRLDDALA